MIPLCTEFKDKVVIITGGNKGIGGGCSEAFTRAGAVVVAAARDQKSGKALAEKLTAAGPGTCEFFPCDVSDHQQIHDMISSTVEKWGRIDCLINNAGYLPKRTRLDEISMEDFRRIMETNFLAMFAGCKYALPHLRKTQGSIINMGSVLGTTGQDGSSMYTATKGAIAAFSKSLAMDEAPNGVRVNIILPGNITSDLGKENKSPLYTDSEDNAARSSMMQWIRRPGTPLEIGWLALFLASSMASYITGAEMLASGGFELGNGVRLDRDTLPSFRPSDMLKT